MKLIVEENLRFSQRLKIRTFEVIKLKGISPESTFNYLKGMRYPARKDDLIRQAKKNNADKNIIDALKTLPDQEYKSQDEVIMVGSKEFHES